jgi:predicted transcriptional regulator
MVIIFLFKKTNSYFSRTISKYADYSRQTINHELNLLEKQKIIKIAFRKIEILDIEKLK